MNMLKNKQAFTLIELIVVITILAILSTIGFVSYSGYLSGVRDTNRISNMKALADGLELHRVKNSLPLPDDYVEVKVNGEIIAYQGYAGKNVIETIEFSNEGLDPKENIYYSYYLTKDGKYFQLMGFLEEEKNVQVAGIFNKTNAVEYSVKFPTVYGDKLGILTDEFNTPINEVSTISASGYIDLSSIAGNYKVHLSDSDVVTASSSVLIKLKEVASNGGKFCRGVNGVNIICLVDNEMKAFGIYYGYPSSLNNNVNEYYLNKVVEDFNNFDTIVLGSGLEELTHEDHQNTIDILNGGTAWYGTFDGYKGSAYGYITLKNDSSSIYSSIDKWKDMGVDGVFFDEAGYDFLLNYGTLTSKSLVRDYQNMAINYAHSKGLKIIINGWVVDDIFGTSYGEAVSTMNSNDSYLLESFVYNPNVTGFYDYDNQIDKIIKSLDYKKQLGIDLYCVGLFNLLSEIDKDKIDTLYEKAFGVCDNIQITEVNFGGSGVDSTKLVNFY